MTGYDHQNNGQHKSSTTVVEKGYYYVYTPTYNFYAAFITCGNNSTKSQNILPAMHKN